MKLPPAGKARNLAAPKTRKHRTNCLHQDGAVLPIEQLSTERLSAAIWEVLGNPEYRQNATQMKKSIVETRGLDKAADLLEQAFTPRSGDGKRGPGHMGA